MIGEESAEQVVAVCWKLKSTSKSEKNIYLKSSAKIHFIFEISCRVFLEFPGTGKVHRSARTFTSVTNLNIMIACKFWAYYICSVSIQTVNYWGKKL